MQNVISHLYEEVKYKKALVNMEMKWAQRERDPEKLKELVSSIDANQKEMMEYLKAVEILDANR